ncbi:hypothetical protein CY35_16G037700 [Sphagnum magellanicum]|nr:hypothetical protein CY35_16G037700 [Sphagnum magellanicum]
MDSDERAISLRKTSRQLRRQPQSGVPSFQENWNLKYDVGVGQSIAGEYNIHKPNDGIAVIHILLDATGSTRMRCPGAKRTKVWQQLLKQFEKLVRETLRDGDVVYIWAFNKTTTLLCKFEAEDLDSNSECIREQYENVLRGEGGRETRLYDAVVEALKFQIGEQKNRSTVDADCFLVPFTDGMDNNSKTNLETMMLQIKMAPINRLHIIFVTANLPQNSPLKEELQARVKKTALIEYETSKAEDMSRAFDDLRTQIKAILTLTLSLDHGRDVRLTRNEEYASSLSEVEEKMSKTVNEMDTFRDGLKHLGWR